MKRKLSFLVLLIPFFLFCNSVYAETKPLSIFPTSIIQGEPFMVQVNGKNLAKVKKITFDGKAGSVFLYNNKPTVIFGVDLYKKPAVYDIIVGYSDGSTAKDSITVGERKKVEAVFSIPTKLGGNTTKSQNNLVSTLVAENRTLENIATGKKAFWTSKFILPLKEITITDTYGYFRTTGAYTIPHKGVDYRASVGTKVMAINRGVVRVVKTYRNYGKTIVIDHGLGIQSFYLHLSKILVIQGQVVESGQVIGLSGQTGYVDAPHLHLSIRISNVSIDPVKFFELFK